ncbi:protein FAR1-RELATED SEQUENCE 5-like [Arachis ipaensis]|uniref:protein FAR1-RELATED SEQUENCE 5-like n=1 Tax=Arachis ipaensis TaxID=130454 RepID=UPI0007AF9A98|nr:protein FAR1-RELATED SEQUENCE 5-like [Arachis ipaensis]
MEVLHSTPTETLGSHPFSFPILSPEEHGIADRDDAVPPKTLKDRIYLRVLHAVHNNGGEGKNNEENGHCDEAVAEDTLNYTIGSETESQMCLDFGDVEGLAVEDIMQKTFRTDDDSYEFYKNFGQYHGFSVRKGDSRRDDDGNVRRMSFFCNKEGLRDPKHYNRLDRRRVHNPETRTNCNAKFSVHLDKSASVWQVRKINNNHNHELTPQVMVHLIPKYRSLTERAKAQIDGFRECGISTAKTMRYMAGLSGGYSLVGFVKKDAYNYIDKQRRKQIVDGDAESAIAYLEGKAEADPMLMAWYNLIEDRMLANMFWADGGSRLDYQYFGDVLAFDSTYKKNKYNRPLVIFSGSNNHKQTTIFGFGLVLDEMIGLYTWLLKSLLEVMCQKMPSVVVTDGDEAMREAVRVVFPRATHRLCRWHFEKNVMSNVKDAGLRAQFSRWLYADIAVNKFLTEWSQAVEEFSLQDSLWINQVFGKKDMWANAYLRDKFCACIRTTSRCEGINSVAKNFLQSKHGMLELVQNLELMVRDYRNNELLVQFRSIDSVPVITTSLESLERCAASHYTRAIFGDV